MGYTTAAIKGFSWLTFIRFITRFVSFGKTIVVARFISPSQFGLFGIVMLTISFVEVITETGVNVFLIQEKQNVDRYLNTAWVVSIARGTIIALFMLIAAPFIANFFKAPDAALLIVIASLIPFLRGFINPAVVLFIKELQFKKESLYRMAILVVEIFATIILLYLYPEPISLVNGIIVGVVFELILSFVFISPRPKFEINKDYIKMIIHHGKWITGNVILNYGYDRGGNIIVGRMLSAQALGIYDMAYRIAMLPITEIADMLVKVVFPVFVKISEDYERLKKAYFRTIIITSLLVTPFGFIFIFFSREIVLLVLGDKWIEVVPVLQILAVLGVMRAISSAIISIQLALRLQKFIMMTTLIGFVGMLITISPLILQFGIIGAAYAITFGYLLSLPFMIYFSYKALRSVKKQAI